MISNAVLLRLDTPTGSTPAGVVTYDVATLSVRCTIVSPTRSMLIAAEANKITVTAQAAIPTRALAVVTPQAGGVVSIRQDGEAAREYWIRFAARNQKAGGLSHWLLGLEAA